MLGCVGKGGVREKKVGGGELLWSGQSQKWGLLLGSVGSRTTVKLAFNQPVLNVKAVFARVDCWGEACEDDGEDKGDEG